MNHRGILWSCDRVSNFSKTKIDFLFEQKAAHQRKNKSDQRMGKISWSNNLKKNSLFFHEVICSAAKARHSHILTFWSRILIISLIANISREIDVTHQLFSIPSPSCGNQYLFSAHASICAGEWHYCGNQIADYEPTMPAIVHFLLDFLCRDQASHDTKVRSD